MPAADERRVPVKTITLLTFRGFRTQIAFFSSAQIDAMDKTFLTLGIEYVVIGRVEDDVKSVAAFEGDPVGIANPSLLGT
jgi:hypothetical protein